MPQSFSNVVVHITFSTKGRRLFLTDAVKGDLHEYLGALCRKKGCPSYGVGGTANHVHIPCSLNRSVPVADLVRHLKANSSRWLKTRGSDLQKFAWQRGYAAASVSPPSLDALRAYIARQEEHHRRRTFKEEVRELLDRCGIEYDERYMWD
jgi:REP element-mobilizing transposase RayT